MGLSSNIEPERRRRMKAAEATFELTDLINQGLAVNVTPDMVRSLIANEWGNLSLYAHIIHRDIEKGFR